MDLTLAHPQLPGQFTYRQLGFARLAAAVENQVTIHRQLHSAGFTDRILESRIAAGIPSRIEISETEDWRAVIRRVVKQMIRTEPQPTTAAEHFLTNCSGHFPRIPIGVLLGKRDTDLHWPTGMYRIKRTKQRLPHRYHVDKIIKDRAKLFFRLHRIQALAVAFPRWRVNLQRGMHHK